MKNNYSCVVLNSVGWVMANQKLLKPAQCINSNKKSRGFENSYTTTALFGVLRDFRFHFKVFNEFKNLLMLE